MSLMSPSAPVEAVYDVALHVTASGDTTVVPGLTNLRFRVAAFEFVRNDSNEGDLVVQFWSGSSSSGRACTGPMHVTTTGQGLAAGDSKRGHFGTDPGEPLVINLGMAGDIGGFIVGWYEY